MHFSYSLNSSYNRPTPPAFCVAISKFEKDAVRQKNLMLQGKLKSLGLELKEERSALECACIYTKYMEAFNCFHNMANYGQGLSRKLAFKQAFAENPYAYAQEATEEEKQSCF